MAHRVDLDSGDPGILWDGPLMDLSSTTPSYAHGGSLVPLLGQTIGQNLHATVQSHGDGDALVVCWQNFRATYDEFWELTSLAARGLLALGVAAGDRVGIWATNRYEWVVIQYATARIGAILVNINPAYLTNELQYVLQQSGVRVLLHGPGFRETSYAPMLAAVRPSCPELRHVVCLDSDWDALLAAGRQVPSAEVEHREAGLQFDDPINIQYTSGTTGSPKGATLTHHNILNNGYFTGIGMHFTAEDRLCIPVPFYHCFGMVLGNLACTTHGACMVIPTETFQTTATLAAVQAERCTALHGVPTMFRTILEDPTFPDRDVSSLRTGIMAGAPCPIELLREVVAKLHMPQVVVGYGMTETSPLSTLGDVNDAMELRVSTVGRVMPHVEISIRDPGTQAIVPRGATGEFCTRGYGVMHGYWGNEEATRASIDSAGWMHSGDLAVMEDNGYVHIVGRLKDMICRGGEKIFPREIEAVLHTHSEISEVQVIGVPSRKYGEEVMAWVRCRPGGCLTEDLLKTFCLERLARFKVPKFWRFVEAFPMTVTGKVQKYRLREMAIAELNLQTAAEEATA
jgi:fatty-acyl-CoA synthase